MRYWQKTEAETGAAVAMVLSLAVYMAYRSPYIDA